MKTINDYLSSTDGTIPAKGKTFSLYGMSIGELLGGQGTDLLFKRGDEIMRVPVAIKLEQFNLPGPLQNPLLDHIIEI
ncbi:hypothetical protein [Pantoea agglomerans]|uniref:hypothetical protein n=1 Tax=Enterobacter agglomerans TaxID=549 RepID=UPI003C7A2DC4